MALQQGSAFAPNVVAPKPTCAPPSPWVRSCTSTLRSCSQFNHARVAPTSRHALAQVGSPRGLSGLDSSRTVTRGGRGGSRRGDSSSKLRMFMFDPGSAMTVAGSLDVSAWSVTSLTSDLAADLFQASLLPYLAFLFFLSRKETKTPEGGTFGFAFLLVFVLATIPAGIYGEPWYSTANDDALSSIAR